MVGISSVTPLDQEIMKDDKTIIEQDDKKDNNDCGPTLLNKDTFMMILMKTKIVFFSCLWPSWTGGCGWE